MAALLGTALDTKLLPLSTPPDLEMIFTHLADGGKRLRIHCVPSTSTPPRTQHYRNASQVEKGNPQSRRGCWPTVLRQSQPHSVPKTWMISQGRSEEENMHRTTPRAPGLQVQGCLGEHEEPCSVSMGWYCELIEPSSTSPLSQPFSYRRLPVHSCIRDHIEHRQHALILTVGTRNAANTPCVVHGTQPWASRGPWDSSSGIPQRRKLWDMGASP